MQFLSKIRKNKKGQAVIELALGLLMMATFIVFIFDAAMVIQAKSESMTLARNGVRLLVMQGVSSNNSKNNAKVEQVKKNIQGLYNANHPDGTGRFITLKPDGIKVESKYYSAIRSASMGENPVFVEVCLQAHPLSSEIFGVSPTLCSAYMGSHSSQMQEGGN